MQPNIFMTYMYVSRYGNKNVVSDMCSVCNFVGMQKVTKNKKIFLEEDLISIENFEVSS